MPVFFQKSEQIPTIDKQVLLIHNKHNNQFSLQLMAYNRNDDSVLQITFSPYESELTEKDIAESEVTSLNFGNDPELAMQFQMALLTYAFEHKDELENKINNDTVATLIKVGLKAFENHPEITKLPLLLDTNNEELLKTLSANGSALDIKPHFEDFSKMGFVACIPDYTYQTKDIDTYTSPCAAILSPTARDPSYFEKQNPKKQEPFTLFKDKSHTYFEDRKASPLLPYSSIFKDNPNLAKRGMYQRLGSVFAFRGDDRSINEIFEAGGFWPNVTRPKTPSNYASIDSLDIGSHQEGGGLPFSALISFSFGIREAAKRANDQYYYVTDVIGGYTEQNRDTEDELTAVGGVDFQNVIAFRKGNHHGPIYFKKEFYEKHPALAHEILLLMSGKQPFTIKEGIEFVDYENKKFGYRNWDGEIEFKEMDQFKSSRSFR
ncbi:hypothetical protein [Aquicella lusitana]|uniref:Uncharacterized protein n=1 Tax=Aquicella lusitana TaxID=254246 RepID=A0A370GKA0_9COXI|nr:hypothetical protein [Aquicella lusitana]RDI43790.1 hypothetical protein C8D86_11060 [Aquicella lusitana]VVC74479.1 hypothetical protein AQULUS_22450 [Aquicella lusitana]